MKYLISLLLCLSASAAYAGPLRPQAIEPALHVNVETCRGRHCKPDETKEEVKAVSDDQEVPFGPAICIGLVTAVLVSVWEIKRRMN